MIIGFRGNGVKRNAVLLSTFSHILFLEGELELHL